MRDKKLLKYLLKKWEKDMTSLSILQYNQLVLQLIEHFENKDFGNDKNEK